MHARELQITSLIHENIVTLLMFAHSWPALANLCDSVVADHPTSKVLNKMVIPIAEKRASRAILEIAVHLRLLNDEFSWCAPDLHFGWVYRKSGSKERLTFRDMTNKILHSRGFEWDLAKGRPLSA